MTARPWRALVAVALLASPAAAQERARLEGRLDRQTLVTLRPVLEQAVRDSVSVRALEDKALEGAAKRVPPPRIVEAVRRLSSELRESRGLLRDARPAARVLDAEVMAAADARRRGVPPAEIAALSREASSRGLVVPLTVLGDLVQRGIPADYARSVLQELMATGLSAERMAAIPGRVDVALRVGAPPMDALRSALPGPARAIPTGPSGAARAQPAGPPGQGRAGEGAVPQGPGRGQPKGGKPATPPGRPPGDDA